jgi:hypothetical protein
LPTIVVASIVTYCCILPLCCRLRYGFAPNIRSDGDGVEMTDQTGPRQSITEQQALQALRIVVNQDGSRPSSLSSSPGGSRPSSL